jgi:hypothetical protein
LSVDHSTIARWVLPTNSGTRLILPPGGHRIEAVVLVGAGHWQKAIEMGFPCWEQAFSSLLTDSECIHLAQRRRCPAGRLYARRQETVLPRAEDAERD